ncbi:MAG: hypothetical protein ACOCXH_01645 [Cyclobacteriaceae bacterium]
MVILNGDFIDLSHFEIVFDGTFFFINSRPNDKISYINNHLYLQSELYEGYLYELQDIGKHTELIVLLLYITEITLNPNLRQDFNSRLATKSAGCSFWDTYHVIAFGFSESEAEYNLASEIDKYEAPGGAMEFCRKIGTMNSSCGIGEHLCVASQTYCCD